MFIKHAFISKKCSGTWYNDKEDITLSIMVIRAGAKNFVTGCREWVQFSIQQRQVNIYDEKVDLMGQGTK